MFNGVPEQFHQFIASRSTLPLPLPLTLPLHVSPPPPTFSVHELQQQPSHQVFQSHLLQPLHRQTSTHESEEKEEAERVVGVNLEIEGMRSASELMDPWLKEEVLALLTIRSSLGNEFSDFIWGHVSRKLAELGYKRSAEKCKEKFEEVSKYCNNNSYGNYYRSFNELEALFEDQNPKSIDDDKLVRNTNDDQEKMEVNMEENSANETLENPIEENQTEENQYVVKKPKKKKKKYHQIELLKGFSEFVNKIMVQQEELHKKLLEDMERREEERVAREEAWKKKEMDRFFKEMEIRAQEQAIACDRESKIVEFLNQFTSNISQTQGLVVQKDNQVFKTPMGKSTNFPTTSPSINVLPENPSSSRISAKPNAPSSSAMILSPQNKISSPTQNNPQMPNSSNLDPSSHHNPNPVNTQTNTNIPPSSSTQLLPLNPKPINSASTDREDYGKRWPRDEVNSLINLRCNLQSSVDDKESTKAPLWERISQGMLELGYKRSAKKCKEKWENINKYFRKTKDTNKKRSLDSKTCPYFHQLNTLYNQGRLTMPSEVPENRSVATPPPETGVGSGASHQDAGLSSEAIVHVNEEGEKNMVQVPLEFEY
ncbi:hypothetical protein AQUCO_04900159v1 [Aquilegia coerulea]|uniref:Myb-like domain-containing protein n=1 Tax=Aquilegia coerulea TaxID=218851 RepID=A0A2G5CK61_AQUCA|nr:hypothetical protein AQUCO_04900159v1 [Aquilegia coerulea]